MSKSTPTLRVYLRRSREDHQHYSIDTQRSGAKRFVEQVLPLKEGKTSLPWDQRVEYIDEDSGGEFVNRREINRLVEESARGDILVCRDQSRFGREILEVTLILRKLITEKGTRVFYYSEDIEVLYEDVVSKILIFARGIGPEFEREAIRSRTREALRERVRQGRVAGGRCYGYKNVRKVDDAGRSYTIQEVDPDQAIVVKRIFEMRRKGYGLRKITKILNDERIPSARRRGKGSGSWSPGAVREMLYRERYRGIVVHGKIVKVDRGGTRIRKKSSKDVLRLEAPHLRIVDDDVW